MRILQVTNIIGPHQLPLARELSKLAGEGNFRFAATDQPSIEREKLGWNSNSSEHWILQAAKSEDERIEFERWWNDADVVLCGGRLFDRMKQRLDKSKLTCYMSERWWKPPIGIARLLHPEFALMTQRFRRLTSSSLFHFLPIGYYAATDMKRIASFHGRMWSWGYFTTTEDPLPSCDRRDRGFQVLWAGRMLGLKKVDTLIKAFARLLCERPEARLTLVGFGPERRSLSRLANRLLPPERYQLLSPMPDHEIRRLMRQHHAYVLPSDGREGWGAVINEAMTEGCAVLASYAVGSARTMIRDYENGLLFAPGDTTRIGELLCQVSRDESFRIRLAQQGQRTIVERWSPAIAAQRFVSVCYSLLANRSVPTFVDGPMSAVWG